MSAEPGDGLPAFLLTRYDEAEAKAQALDGREWEYRDSWVWGGSTEIADVFNLPDTDDAGTFIADVNPAHRLADIALKRAILAEHERVTSKWDETGCKVCDWDSDCGRVMDNPEWCRTVRQLGTEFAKHPAYQEGWKP